MERFSIHRQARLLIVICLFDLISTVWIVRTGRGDEANPIMAFFLAQGIIAFVAAKLCLVAAPVATLEWARPKRPQFVKRAYYAAFMGYICFYIAGVAKANTVREPHGMKVQLEAQRLDAWGRIKARIDEKRAMAPPVEPTPRFVSIAEPDRQPVVINLPTNHMSKNLQVQRVPVVVAPAIAEVVTTEDFTVKAAPAQCEIIAEEVRRESVLVN